MRLNVRPRLPGRAPEGCREDGEVRNHSFRRPRTVDWQVRNFWAGESVLFRVIPSPRESARKTGKGWGGEKTPLTKAPAEKLASALFRPPARRLATAQLWAAFGSSRPGGLKAT